VNIEASNELISLISSDPELWF